MKKNYFIFFMTYCFIFAVSTSYAKFVDPTRPATLQSVTAFHIDQIVISPQRKFAIINGQTVHVGDQFSDAKVVSIESNKVVLQGPDGEMELTMRQVFKKIHKD